jgi:hypothetical protein
MSSKRFVADLKPDPHLRNIVMLAGCAAALIGLVLLIRLPIPVPIRLVLMAVWAVLSLRQLDRQARGGHRTTSIRLEPGETSIIDRRGRQVPVQIMSGSVVLPRLAWLRLKFRDGLEFCELLHGDATKNAQWRRLQILWRQGPRAFGGAREADTISTRKSGSHF